MIFKSSNYRFRNDPPSDRDQGHKNSPGDQEAGVPKSKVEATIHESISLVAALDEETMVTPKTYRSEPPKAKATKAKLQLFPP